MSSATPRLISRRVSFWLAWMLFVPVGLAGPPIDPANLAELPEHQDPRSAEMASVLSANDWSVPATPRPWGSALVGESVALHGEVLQHGGFPHPWRDLEEWFVSTEHGTVAVYMKTPSERPPVGAKVKLRGWRWPSVAVESRGGGRSSFLAMLAFDWQTVPPGFPAWGVPVAGSALILLVLHWVRRWSRLAGGTVATGTLPRAIRLRSDLPHDPAKALAALRDQVDSPTDQEGSECQVNSHLIPEEDQPG